MCFVPKVNIQIDVRCLVCPDPSVSMLCNFCRSCQADQSLGCHGLPVSTVLDLLPGGPGELPAQPRQDGLQDLLVVRHHLHCHGQGRPQVLELPCPCGARESFSCLDNLHDYTRLNKGRLKAPSLAGVADPNSSPVVAL